MKSRESWEFKKSKKVGEKGKVEKVEPVFLTKNQKNRKSRIFFFLITKNMFSPNNNFFTIDLFQQDKITQKMVVLYKMQQRSTKINIFFYSTEIKNIRTFPELSQDFL